MTELLEVLPEDHPKRNDLIEFLNTLCEGYLALQDDEGMWHQVLNDHESYPETSCTSMFIYAFSRGIRFGWLKNPEKYVKAIYKAWKGISKTVLTQTVTYTAYAAEVSSRLLPTTISMNLAGT